MSINPTKDFELTSDFSNGYQARKDDTNIPAGILIKGSQNVLTKTTGRVGIAKGYSIDGTTSTINAGIEASFDCDMNFGQERNLRSYTDPDTGKGVLQFRWKDANGNVTWNTLTSTLKRGLLRFTRFFDYLSEKNDKILFVDDSTNVHEWSGAVATLASASTTTGLISQTGIRPDENDAGIGYKVGDIVTIGGTGTGGTAEITSVNDGTIIAWSFYNTGVGYKVGDIVQAFWDPNYSGPLQPTKPAVFEITSVVDTGYTQLGAVTGMTMLDGGAGFRTDASYYVCSGGSGNGGVGGVTVVATSVGSSINAVKLLTPGSGYTTGTSIAVVGGSGTDGKVEINSVLDNTLTLQGDLYWGEIGFNALSNNQVIIGTTTYTYTQGVDSKILTGIYPAPITTTTGDLVFQAPVTTPNSSITTLPDQLPISLIGTFRNQVYYASESENEVYVSKVNNYKDCSVSVPRIVGEGALLHLDDNITAFVPQENEMYIAAGKGQWYNTKFDIDYSNAKEALTVERLKTASKQAPRTQEYITNDKNNVIFLSQEPVLTTLGRVSGVISTPQSNDISWPIINDFNSYTWTGGASKYHKNFIYVSSPLDSIVRVYNQTKADNQYWEAPLTYPVAMFSIIDGEIYGHSYSSPETYKLFDGGSFNGSPYTAIAKFSYNNYGNRANTKGFSQWYSEGYISGNTNPLYLGLEFEVDGCATSKEFPFKGDSKFVCAYKSDAPLGKSKLGNNPLGGQKDVVPALPPKFRWIKSFLSKYFYEHSVYYKSTGIDMDWEILAFGPRFIQGKDMSNNITE